MDVPAVRQWAAIAVVLVEDVPAHETEGTDVGDVREQAGGLCVVNILALVAYYGDEFWVLLNQ